MRAGKRRERKIWGDTIRFWIFLSLDLQHGGGCGAIVVQCGHEKRADARKSGAGNLQVELDGVWEQAVDGGSGDAYVSAGWAGENVGESGVEQISINAKAHGGSAGRGASDGERRALHSATVCGEKADGVDIDGRGGCCRGGLGDDDVCAGGGGLSGAESNHADGDVEGDDDEWNWIRKLGLWRRILDLDCQRGCRLH